MPTVTVITDIATAWTAHDRWARKPSIPSPIHLFLYYRWPFFTQKPCDLLYDKNVLITKHLRITQLRINTLSKKGKKESKKYKQAGKGE